MTAMAIFATVSASVAVLFIYLTHKEEMVYNEDMIRLLELEETIKKTRQSRTTYVER